jgi:cation transporter-like permease
MKKLSHNQKKRFFLIIFIILPLCFVFGFLMGSYVLDFMNIDIVPNLLFIIIVAYVILYLLCIVLLYRAILRTGE